MQTLTLLPRTSIGSRSFQSFKTFQRFKTINSELTAVQAVEPLRSVPIVEDMPEVIILPELCRKPGWSFQMFRITSRSAACARWMCFSVLMTDKNTSICYLNRIRNPRWRAVS